ncbi:MAG: GIY-YIG nuclease family protein [Bacteroidales bacterium]|nr:GIY-YIG nuclease family protein [Bacteroidales bacterium]
MNKETGCIYILTNPSFPEYVKIGYATNLENRLKQLNRSETIPYAFRAYAIYEVDKSLTDKELHKLIDKLNPDLRTIDNFDGKARVKEFYAMSAEDAYGLLECIAKISGTTDRLKKVKPEGHEIIDEQTAAEIKETARRGPFRFGECHIPIGAELIFADDPSIKVTVLDDRHIKYGNETTSLSALAQRIKGFDHPIQGTLYFTYKGELLTALRDRLGK